MLMMAKGPLPPPGSAVLTLEQVAAYLQCSIRTIQRKRKAGKFPRPAFGGDGEHPRWLKSDIDLYLQEGSIHNFRRAKRGD